MNPNTKKTKMTGSEIFVRALIEAGAKVVFGYPGGANMPIYDALYFYEKKLRHILVRHEQGAAHAAEGYARITGKPGVCLVTSGPGATNLVTGIADAMMDSVPMVAITGQVAAQYLGSDAFQETDVLGITTPITKWNHQVTEAKDIAPTIAKAFYIAKNGRPGPVVVDITKNAQFEEAVYNYPKNFFIPKIKNSNRFNSEDLKTAADFINKSKRPLMLVGHGVLIAEAQRQVQEVMEKCAMPAAVTLHGLSAVSPDHPLYVGMLGMHGNYSPNVLTNKSDLIFAIGMRFDDRVTGKLASYAPGAKVVHIDIDPSEHHKNVRAHLAIAGDAKDVLLELMPYLKKNNHDGWIKKFERLDSREIKVSEKRKTKNNGKIHMDEVISMLSNKTNGKAVVVADVGQNQMFSARYYRYRKANGYITSGGLGTMGFAVPAAIGAKIAGPESQVIAVVGDGGFQMTIQELGTIMQEKLPVKIILLNNGYLGMVRQWQQLFFDKRYSATTMKNPDFIAIARGYRIEGKKVEKKEDLDDAMDRMLKHQGAYLLEVEVVREDNIFPMVPTGAAVDEIRLE